MRKLFLRLTLLAIACTAVLFVLVDQRVSRRLRARGGSNIPAIVSAPFQVRARQIVRPTVLRGELLRRGYSETGQVPQSPGEFRIEGETLEMYLRGFRSAHGEQISPLEVRYHFLTGEIRDDDGHELSSFALEPKIVAQLGGGNRRVHQYKDLQQIPESLRTAIIAVEDQRFFRHLGLDFLGITRAMLRNISAGRIVEGGSTLTQQLAKNLLFSPKKTITRKVLEALAALSLELRLTKEEILERYLNEVYFGQEGSVAIHGVESASYAFFGKSVERLSVSEAALLAGLVRAPSAYSPVRHPERARNRRNLVLTKMYQEGFLSQAAADHAKKAALEIRRTRSYPRTAAYFSDALQRELAEQVDLQAAILSRVTVWTGIIPGMQECAQEAVTAGLRDIEKQHPRLAKHPGRLEAGLVAVEPFSGLIRAWIGGRNYGESQFDHVAQSERQIGSTVKPFLYLAALDQNLNSYKVATPRSILIDEPMEIPLRTGQIWRPENYDREFRGKVTLRYALERSLNVPAAYVGQRIGVPSLVEAVRRFRVTKKNPPAVPSLALGAADTSLLRLTAAYAALANGGIYVQPRLFVTARDGGGEVLATSQIREEPVANENAVYVLTDILQGVINRGTATAVRRLGFERPAAGKTGTSSDNRDAWFVGFTPTLAVGVWVGLDDGSSVGLTGGGAATPVWANFMTCAEPYFEEADFVRPSGVVTVPIDPVSGRRWTPDCSGQPVNEVYVRGTEPTESCGSGFFSRSAPEAYETEISAPRPKRRQGSFWDKLFSSGT